jgi:hypothetical protein
MLSSNLPCTIALSALICYLLIDGMECGTIFAGQVAVADKGVSEVSLVFALATVILAAPSFSLSKGAFVGVFTSDGKPISLPAPTGERWVSNEQVQRELLFRGWTPPLTNLQLAELAKSLEADFAVDVLATTLKVGKKWQALVAMRVVSAQLGEIVHLALTRAEVSAPEGLQQIVGQVFPALLSKLPSQIPLATVQLCEGKKRVHLTATDGEWGKGVNLLFFRTSGAQIMILGKGRIVFANLIPGSNRWILEADLLGSGISLRSGDKAVQIFNLPKPLAKWQ